MAEAVEPDAVLSVRPHLHADESIEVAVRADDVIVAVTDRRLMVKVNTRLALAIPFGELRRIQFDVERQRPATLVIVPEDPREEAQVLAVPNPEVERVAFAIAAIARQFSAAG